MSEDGATENPRGRVTLECQATLTAVSCHNYSPPHCRFLGRHKLQFFALLELFQKMLQQLLSLTRGVLIALHLTFAQNSYCGCEFCIFLYSIICNKLSIWLLLQRGCKLSPLSHCWLHIHCCRVSKFSNFLPLRLRFSLSTLFTVGRQLLLLAAVLRNCRKTLNMFPHFLVENLKHILFLLNETVRA